MKLFERFFDKELKQCIIDATKSNGYDLHMNDFDTFLDILIISSYNIRSNQRDYWSQDAKLNCVCIKNSMSRNKFLEIKKNLKYSQIDD